MKKKLMLLALTFNFYCINTSYSQKTITLTTTSNGSYNLNKYSKIEVITNLPDSNNLGFIPSDILNDRKNVKPSDNVTMWLQSFVNKQFVSDSNSKADALLWVIQDLSMGKDSTQKEALSFLKLKADIYSGNESNYQLINTFDSTWIVNGDGDFSQLIAAAFIELYKNSVSQAKGSGNIRFQQSATKLTGTRDSIIAQIKATNTNAILNTAEYPDGVYLSFNEFKSNSPSVNRFYADVNPVSKMVSLYKLAVDSSSELIQNAWGLSINNELYFYADGQLYPIEKSGNSFYMAKYLEPRTRKNQAIYWRKIIGSRQGDTNPYNDAHILRRTVPTAKNVSLEATHLDFDTQDFIY
jgi:hypothetical protein